MRTIFLMSSLSLFACTGEEEIKLTQLYPQMVLSTEELNMEVVVLYDGQEEFQIMNTGLAELEVTSISISDNADGMYRLAPIIEEGTLLEVEPSEPLTVVVDFEPETYRRYDREIIITSNDPENPEFHLPLNGEGIDGPIPDIHITPRTLDFGTVAQNESELKYFVLSNQGAGDLIIDSIELEGDSAFQLQSDLSGVSYGLEQSANIVVTYSPTEEGGDNASLTITSNDPDEQEQKVVLLGNGGGDYEIPVAVIDCPTNVDPPKVGYFSAAESYDPDGQEPLIYQWTLNSRPAGSSTEVNEPTLEQTTMLLDVAGDYNVGLVVSNALGVESEPVSCDVFSIPDESIHVELSWDANFSDVDLHMVLEGYDFFSYAGDCCWCNPNPEWGEEGGEDDPIFSLDNRIGYGPEEIHIETPVDGAYNIFVNYFDDHGGGDTTATIRVYIDGQMVAEEHRLLEQRELWDDGYIYWEGGVGAFAVQNESPVEAEVFACH